MTPAQDSGAVHRISFAQIARSNRGLNSSFTVRKISYGEGVERVFRTPTPSSSAPLNAASAAMIRVSGRYPSGPRRLPAWGGERVARGPRRGDIPVRRLVRGWSEPYAN